MGVMIVWHEGDSLWERIPKFGEHQWQAGLEEVDGATSLLGIEPGAAILDLPVEWAATV